MNLIEYQFVPGKRKNSVLLYIKSEKQLYRRKNKYDNKIRYECYQKNCNISVLLENDVCKPLSEQRLHLHPTQDELVQKMRIHNDIKLACANESLNRNATREIFLKECEKNKDFAHLVDYKKIQRNLCKIKNAAILEGSRKNQSIVEDSNLQQPQLPIDCQDEINFVNVKEENIETLDLDGSSSLVSFYPQEMDVRSNNGDSRSFHASDTEITGHLRNNMTQKSQDIQEKYNKETIPSNGNQNIEKSDIYRTAFIDLSSKVSEDSSSYSNFDCIYGNHFKRVKVEEKIALMSFFKGVAGDVLTLSHQNQRYFKRKLVELIDDLHNGKKS